MRPWLWAGLVVLVAAAGLPAADPPVEPKVRMPVIQSASPVVPPDAPIKLTADTLYVIDSDIPLLVLCSPDGPLKVVGEDGPLRIRGRFADGTGKVETRTFKGKHVYTVDVAEGKSGRCELLVVPVGVQKEGEIIRRLIDAGTGPQPPPQPPVPPEPQPGPVTAGKRFVVVVEETSEAAATRGALFADPVLAARVKDKGHRWRIVDKDVVGPDGQPPTDIKRFLDAAKGKPMPQVFLVDEKGKTLVQTALPTKAADLIKLLEQWGG